MGLVRTLRCSWLNWLRVQSRWCRDLSKAVLSNHRLFLAWNNRPVEGRFLQASLPYPLLMKLLFIPTTSCFMTEFMILSKGAKPKVIGPIMTYGKSCITSLKIDMNMYRSLKLKHMKTGKILRVIVACRLGTTTRLTLLPKKRSPHPPFFINTKKLSKSLVNSLSNRQDMQTFLLIVRWMSSKINQPKCIIVKSLILRTWLLKVQGKHGSLILLDLKLLHPKKFAFLLIFFGTLLNGLLNSPGAPF